MTTVNILAEYGEAGRVRKAWFCPADHTHWGAA